MQEQSDSVHEEIKTLRNFYTDILTSLSQGDFSENRFSSLTHSEGEYLTTEEAYRLYTSINEPQGLKTFSHLLNHFRSNTMNIPTKSFTQFCEILEFALTKADKYEDFHTATILMNMTATYYR